MIAPRAPVLPPIGGAGSIAMSLHYLFLENSTLLCTDNTASSQPGCHSGGAKSEWFIRISKVGNASLLVVEVLINLSNQEDEKNSSEFFEAPGASSCG